MLIKQQGIRKVLGKNLVSTKSHVYLKFIPLNYNQNLYYVHVCAILDIGKYDVTVRNRTVLYCTVHIKCRNYRQKFITVGDSARIFVRNYEGTE